MKKEPRGTILVVDDSPQTLEVIQRNLEAENYSVFIATSVSDGLNILDSEDIDLVITDLKMPKVGGIELIKHIRDNYRDMEVIMITGYPSVESAIQAVKLGADDYISKPFTDKELLSAVEKSLEKLYARRKTQKSSYLKEKYGIIGESEVMQSVYKIIEKASITNATILITGESGTGKELVARAIHYKSDRASAPFVAFNCGGIPEELLESALFGHIKGAFTGASETRAGFFQTADGGTIFLDEISEASLSMQTKLLRVLQEKEIFMVGSDKPIKVDVRIITATNKNLEKLIEKGMFREDLYFRLNVINIFMPPLRERGDDIYLLINYFLKKYAEELEKPIPHLTDSALDILKKYYWPGNIRELENVIHRLIIMCEDEKIDAPDLPEFMRYTTSRGKNINRTLEEIEMEHIRNVLSSVGNNKTKAAKILGISRKTLLNKLKKAKKSE